MTNLRILLPFLAGGYGLLALADLVVSRLPIPFEAPWMFRAGFFLFLGTQIVVIPASLALGVFLLVKGQRKGGFAVVIFSMLLSLLFVRISSIQFWSSVLLLNITSVLILLFAMPRVFKGHLFLKANPYVASFFCAVLSLTLHIAYLREGLLALARLGVAVSPTYTSLLSGILASLLPANGILFFLSQLQNSWGRRVLPTVLTLGSLSVAAAYGLILSFDTSRASALVGYVMSKTSLGLSGYILPLSGAALALFVGGLLLALVASKKLSYYNLLGLLLLFTSLWLYGSPYLYGPATIGVLLLSTYVDSLHSPSGPAVS